MLYQRRFHERIRSGEICATLRIWQRPHAKLGGRYALGGGAIVVDKIREMSLDDITASLSRRCGSQASPTRCRLPSTAQASAYSSSTSTTTRRARAPNPQRMSWRRKTSSRSRSGSKRWTGVRGPALGPKRRYARSKLGLACWPRASLAPSDARATSSSATCASSRLSALKIGYRLTPKGEALLAGPLKA